MQSVELVSFKFPHYSARREINHVFFKFRPYLRANLEAKFPAVFFKPMLSFTVKNEDKAFN